MEERIKIPKAFILVCFIFILAGVAGFIHGFGDDAERTWANFLLNNYYFLSISLGAAFFLSVQSITQSGWSAAFRRVPEALMAYVPFSAVFFLVLLGGIHDLYHWSHDEAVETDAILAHKAPYLNVPFFYIRLIVYFVLWILMIKLIRGVSLKEDMEGGLKWFYKSEIYSRAFIFILAITFTLATIDWIMSIEPHWYSTIFALKNFISAFLHGTSIIVLIIIILHSKGRFPYLNKNHIHDFSRYIFILAIIWGYFWFSQFMLIWYGNIPEETIYYSIRWEHGFKTLFYLNVLINWGLPFVILMPRKPGRSKAVLLIITLFLIAGQWIDLYLQIFPGVIGRYQFGITELLTWLGYASLFSVIVIHALSRANLVPIKHPYLEESKKHHF